MALPIKTIGISAAVLALGVVGTGIYMNASNDASATESNTTAQAQTNQKPPQEKKSNTIVDAAAANPDFSTLVTAVKAAGLTETLSGDTKLTVFAPTNAAFAKLPAGTVETLLKPENKQQLASILTYHVVPGEILSSQLTDGQKIKTVNGAELTVVMKDGGVYLHDATGMRSMVTKPDMRVDNGVIHAIDTVVMPQ